LSDQGQTNAGSFGGFESAGNGAAEGMDGMVEFTLGTTNSLPEFKFWNTSVQVDGTTSAFVQGAGYWRGGSAITAIRFQSETGSFQNNGSYILSGLRTS
jgi:hypothetical protein